jgi:hypothetical protein
MLDGIQSSSAKTAGTTCFLLQQVVETKGIYNHES